MGDGASQRRQEAAADFGELGNKQTPDLLIRLGDGLPEKTHDDAPAAVIISQPAHRRQKGMNDGLQIGAGLAGPGFQVIQQPQPFSVQGGQATREDGLDQLIFGPVVIMDGRQVDTGFAGDAAQGRTMKPALGKHPLGRIQDPIFRIPLLRRFTFSVLNTCARPVPRSLRHPSVSFRLSGPIS